MEAPTKRIKVLMSKVNTDGHWRGVAVVSKALRDAGMEVIYTGPLTGKEIAAAAIQEDVDVIGLNICGRYEQIEELIPILRGRKIDDMLIIVGGTIPPEHVPKLKEMGISGIFPPGSILDDIVKYVREHVKE